MVKGIIASASWLVRYHGEETIAKDMLHQLGITRKDAEQAGCETYDMEPLIESNCL
jgi:hypothetical protein